MKILFIAGFLDEEVRRHDIFRKYNHFIHLLIRIFGLPGRVGQLNDHAPWIRNIISDLEKHCDIELHVFGPQIRLKKRLTEFESRGVKYYFYSSEWTSLLRKLNRYKLWKRFINAEFYFKKVLDIVNPDLVVLSGAENPATSISILYADKYPRFCLCQTIYNNPERAKYCVPNRLIQDMEKDIFSKLHFFGVYSKLHYDLLKELKPDAIILKYGYPSKGVLIEPSEVEKEFDFVNFALMHGSRKGTPDSIEALAIVKKKFPHATLNIVGGCDETIRVQLEQKIIELGLAENVTFTPFFEKERGLLLHVQKSRFAVLPCKLDHISGTMNQSMQLGLPLIVYKTTGTPTFNQEKECVLIAEKGNVEELAQHMLTLMEQPEKAKQLAKNAREYQQKKAEYNKGNGDRLIANFKAIIENYLHGTPIPQNQLFNPEMDV